MMFITPMPPTSSEIAAIPPSSAVRTPVNSSATWTSAAWVLTVKSASASVTWWLARSAVFTSW